MIATDLKDIPDRDFRFVAGWFYSGEGHPLPNVAIDVTDGIISDIHQLSGNPTSRLWVIPPLVNAHTHLELSDCHEPIPAGVTFPDWIHKVMAHRARRTDEAVAREAGVAEIDGAGTAYVADTVPCDMTPVVGAGVRSFVEYIGMTDDRMAAATAHAESLTPGDRFGISPHAPYSVHPDLLERLVNIARQSQVPMMMHLAETREEQQLLTSGKGPFAAMLQSFGIWQDDLFPRLSVCDYIDQVTMAPRALFAHGNYFGNAEIDLLASRTNATVVVCPRTHAHFAHDPHPWPQMLERGINVAVGTDSRASNPDLNVWREAIALRRSASTFPPRDLLRILTANGVRALFGHAGRLEVGSPATWSVLQAEPQSREFWTLFESCSPIAAAVAGRWLPRGSR